MTAPWICRTCDMLCLGQKHFDRHRAGDHSLTTDAEWAEWQEQQRAKWASRTGGVD